MIISASRRTDIPARFWPWFVRRLREGFVCVRNPMNPRSVSRVWLSPDVVDGIVLWTKNPMPMMSSPGWQEALGEYAYYFQFTLTGYGPEVEPGLPDKDGALVPAFLQLAKLAGRERVIWRYDPIILTERYTVPWHLRRFEELAQRLAPCTERCVISFLDYYRGTAKRLDPLNPTELGIAQQQELAAGIARIAREHSLRVYTCAEAIDLSTYGIGHSSCIDGALLERLCGCPLDTRKDKSQRVECGCVESIDIGAYDSCQNGCLYCYANHSGKVLLANASRHDPASPLLIGHIGPDDKVNERKMRSFKVTQLKLD